MRWTLTACLATFLSSACGGDVVSSPCGEWVGEGPPLGAVFDNSGCQLSVRVASTRATRIEAWFYREPVGEVRLKVVLEAGAEEFAGLVTRDDLTAAGVGEVVYYGFRAWGPNWPFDEAWEPGTSRGLREDVDIDGNRFNPNKLVLDPYALEHSHDPGREMANFASGPDYRHIDTGPTGPKGAVLPAPAESWQRPSGLRSADVVYEVHVRGLTMNDPAIAASERGTYAGAARKAAYLKSLGVTAIELLPVHETNNEYNGEVEGQGGDNYWGYASLGFFAPERRYSSDQSAGGPTREFRDMVRAFHAEGIKVYIDVVYNHTAETGTWDADGRTTMILSMRGLDNAAYYQLGPSGRDFRNDNGVGPNVAVANPLAADMVVDSLRYWHDVMGVDGFRFDLASVLGNTCASVCFDFEAQGESLLARIGQEIPTADLIAEPWSATSYQMGDFLAPWAEWNDAYRDAVRRHINKEGVDQVTPRELIARLGGSPDRFADDGRDPAASVNFVVSHDGFTLADLFACNDKVNGQPWPYGPSPGGSDNNISWDHGGDPAAQREAARTAMALLFVSPGVPMFVGGDEFLRSQRCNNNMFNLDNDANWLDWQAASVGAGAVFTQFVRELGALRATHPALRPISYATGRDADGNGLADAAWLTDLGVIADGTYLDDPGRRYIALLLDGAEAADPAAALYVGYNGATIPVTATLPAPPTGTQWRLVLDTQRAREGQANINEPLEAAFTAAPRSLFVALAD